jgi:hypothetical protein
MEAYEKFGKRNTGSIKNLLCVMKADIAIEFANFLDQHGELLNSAQELRFEAIVIYKLSHRLMSFPSLEFIEAMERL